MGEVTWTTTRVDLLKSHFHAGMSCREIAQSIGGVSRNAVIGKLVRLGLMGGEKSQRPARSAQPRAPRPEARAKKMVRSKQYKDAVDRVLTEDEVTKINSSVPDYKIAPVTDEESRRESALAILKGSWDPDRDWCFPPLLKRNHVPTGDTWQPKCSEPMPNMLVCGDKVVEGTARCAAHGGKFIKTVKYTGYEPNHHRSLSGSKLIAAE